MSKAARALMLVTLLALAGCAYDRPATELTPAERADYVDKGIDPTPLKKDGSRSFEFEEDDLDRAAVASEAVEEYCAGAVS